MLKKMSHKIMLVFVTGLLAFSTIAIAKAAIKEEEEKKEPILEEKQLEIPQTDTTDFILAMTEEVWKQIDEEKKEEHQASLLAEKAEAEKIEKEKAEQLAREEEAQRKEKLRIQKEREAAATRSSVQTKQVKQEPGTSFTATHYTAYCNGCSGITATGINARQSIYHEGYRVVAVDPTVIKLGSIVEVTTPYGSFTAIAGDTGGDIKGNKIDILVGSTEEAYRLGVVNAQVRVVSNGS